MGLAKGARTLEALVRSIIVARLLPLEGFAAYAVALAFVGFAIELANLNLGAVVMTYGARYLHDSRSTNLKALFKVTYLATIVIAVAAGLIVAVVLGFSYSIFIEYAGLYVPVVVLGFAAAFNLVDQVNKSALRLLDRFKVSCLMDVVVAIISMVFMFVFLQLVPAIPANAIYGASICLVLSGTVSIVMAWREISKKASGWKRANLMQLAGDYRPMLRLAVGNSLAMSARRAMLRGDVLLLAAVASPAAVGIYDIGKKLSRFILLARDALALAVFPQIASAIVAGHYDELRIMLSRLVILGIPFSTFVLLVIWYIGQPLIVFVYGETYADAAPIFWILTISSLLYLLFFWGNSLMLNLRRVRMQMIAHAVGLCVMVAAGMLLAPAWHAAGMAWAVVIGTSAQYLIVSMVARNSLYSSDSVESKTSKIDRAGSPGAE